MKNAMDDEESDGVLEITPFIPLILGGNYWKN